MNMQLGHTEALAPAARIAYAPAPRQGLVGVGLAAGVIAGWIALHVAGVFALPGAVALALSPVLVAVQCWLSVGLFIIAHDAMHGSLAPRRPGVNRFFGRVAVMVYACIWYDGLVQRHFMHHRASGTAGDPDFHEQGDTSFWRWYGSFMTEYLTVAQLAGLVLFSSAQLALGVELWRLLTFWALPAILSSLQLFYFGTYLPHRRESEAGFVDGHHARSNGYPWLVSLLTCFHFGYHHEHHLAPTAPWWRLPHVRAALRARA